MQNLSTTVNHQCQQKASGALMTRFKTMAITWHLKRKPPGQYTPSLPLLSSSGLGHTPQSLSQRGETVFSKIKNSKGHKKSYQSKNPSLPVSVVQNNTNQLLTQTKTKKTFDKTYSYTTEEGQLCVLLQAQLTFSLQELSLEIIHYNGINM